MHSSSRSNYSLINENDGINSIGGSYFIYANCYWGNWRKLCIHSISNNKLVKQNFIEIYLLTYDSALYY